MVSYNTFRIAYTFGSKTGYTRANAYMEAARCLRFFLARDVQILDKSMGLDVDIEDICEFIDFDDCLLCELEPLFKWFETHTPSEVKVD